MVSQEKARAELYKGARGEVAKPRARLLAEVEATGCDVRRVMAVIPKWEDRAMLRRFLLGEMGLARTGGTYKMGNVAEGSVEKRAHEEKLCLHCLKVCGVERKDDETHLFGNCDQTRVALMTLFPVQWCREAWESVARGGDAAVGGAVYFLREIAKTDHVGLRSKRAEAFVLILRKVVDNRKRRGGVVRVHMS